MMETEPRSMTIIKEMQMGTLWACHEKGGTGEPGCDWHGGRVKTKR